ARRRVHPAGDLRRRPRPPLLRPHGRVDGARRVAERPSHGCERARRRTAAGTGAVRVRRQRRPVPRDRGVRRAPPRARGGRTGPGAGPVRVGGHRLPGRGHLFRAGHQRGWRGGVVESHPGTGGKRMRSSDRVLVCTAHPDDEMLIAGTLRRLCLAGVEVTLLCATRGELGAIRDAAVADRATIDEVRAGELAASAAVIGIARVLQFHYPDSEVEHWRGLLLGDIAAAISEIDPHLVITFGPDGVTRHGDHISVSRATTDAVLASTAATGTA